MLKLGYYVRCKEVTCTITGNKFRDVGVLAKKLGKPYNTVHNWFIGKGKRPENFHYIRESDKDRSIPFHQKEGYKETKDYE